MAKRISKLVGPKSLVTLTLQNISVNAAGVANVEAFAVDARGGVTALQTVAEDGVAKNANQVVHLEMDLITGSHGNYYDIEIVANRASANPVTLLPNDSFAQLRLYVLDVKSIS